MITFLDSGQSFIVMGKLKRMFLILSLNT